jgi:hypothetical protein
MRRALIALALAAPLTAVAQHGTVAQSGDPLFSFEQLDSTTRDGPVRTIRLCWPRHLSYQAKFVVNSKDRSFAFTFCPWMSDPARLRPEDCVAFRALPTLASFTNVPSEATLPSVFERGEERFEFYWADATAETVRNWFAEEWRHVDGPLLFALSEWLSMSIHTNNTYTNEAKLLLPLLPIEQIRRVDKARVTVDSGTTAFCDDADPVSSRK